MINFKNELYNTIMDVMICIEQNFEDSVPELEIPTQHQANASSINDSVLILTKWYIIYKIKSEDGKTSIFVTRY